ncbi:MAG: cytochrome c biogenesis protein CcsA [Gammaproteobacteria bacterium]|nr:cytochrome c biogenesis protein CcsA [Gammaproteobacteria bacterium]MCW8923188.1 cytochrome c biogenesis protein CcsA [Gammaproteobacteria bacterium]
MNIIFAALTATILYLLCTLGLLLHLRHQSSLKNLSKPMLLAPGFVALSAHIFILYSTMISPVGINFSFYSSLSLISASIALLTLLSSVRHPIEIMGIIVLPIAAATIIIDTLQSTSNVIITGSSNGLLFHIISSIIAYSILGLAAVHAVVLSIQNRFLHRHQPGGFIRFLPPLKTMESLLFEIIIIGFVGLSISLASGFIFLENIFAQHLVHKTTLSMFAWIVFAILLFGHWFIGWRGRTAVRWTLGGFFSLMLAYFGSKFVLEVLLK